VGTIAQGMGQYTPFEVLRSHRFTQGLTDSQLSALAALARPVRFEADEVVLSAGQRSSDFYLLVSGSVAVELCPPRFALCVQSLGPGDVCGWSAQTGGARHPLPGAFPRTNRSPPSDRPRPPGSLPARSGSGHGVPQPHPPRGSGPRQSHRDPFCRNVRLSGVAGHGRSAAGRAACARPNSPALR